MKKLSKKHYGTSHVISLDEAEFVHEKDCDTLMLETGQYGKVKLSPETAVFFEHHGCQVILTPTPDAIGTCNKTRGEAKAIGHLTSAAEPFTARIGVDSHNCQRLSLRNAGGRIGAADD